MRQIHASAVNISASLSYRCRVKQRAVSATAEGSAPGTARLDTNSDDRQTELKKFCQS